MIRFASLAAAAALIASPALAQAEAGKVTLTLDTGAGTGAVMIALFDAKDAYDGGAAPVASARVDVAAGQHEAVFENLPAGDYAAKMYHDVNGDGRMNTNPFGMPTEPYAFSNNAVGNMGPASWERARFSVTGDVAQTIEIK